MVVEHPKIDRTDFTEEYFGINIQDPYRYMEDPDDIKTKQFVDINNKLVEEYLDESDVKFFTEKLTEVMNNTTHGVPVKKGDRYFHTKMSPEQRQPVIYMRKGLTGKDKSILDINKLSDDGTTASMVRSYSGDGKYLATSLSVHGSDWQHIFIKEIDNDLVLEKLEWVTFSTISWNHENTGFYYSKYPNQNEMKDEDKKKFQKIYFHKIKTPQEEDTLIYDPLNKDHYVSSSISDDGKYLFISVSESTLPGYMLLLKETDSNNQLNTIVDKFDGSFYSVIGSVDDILFIRTSFEAPNNRIMAIDLTNHSKQNWNELVAENEHTLSSANIFNNQLILI